MAHTSWIRLRLPGPQEGLQLIHGAGQRLQTSCVRQRPRHAASGSSLGCCLSICRRLLRAVRLRARDLSPAHAAATTGKKTDHNPNRDPRPMLQRAHGREIHTFARFGGCAAATSFPAPASWSAGAGAGDELFPPSPSSSCCPAGRLAAALRLVSTISHRRGENTREGRGEAREGDAKRKQDETEGRGEENKTEGFVVLADGRRKNKIRPPPPPIAGQAADRSDWAVELSSIPRAQSGEAEQRINGGDIVQAFLMMGS
jgi:hypothetical protein